MMKWYSFDPSKWRKSRRVAKMDLASRGAYFELINFQFTQDNGMIPFEPDLFWQYARCTPAEWEAVKSTVLPMFQSIECDGQTFLFNETMLKHWKEAKQSYEQKIEAGRKGGRHRALAYSKRMPSERLSERLSVCSSENQAHLHLQVLPSPEANASEGNIPSKKKAASTTDSRFTATHNTIFTECRSRLKLDPDWNGAEAKQLSEWLKANPTLTQDQINQMVKNAYASERAPGRPCKWIPFLTEWADGPKDKFKNVKASARPNGKAVATVTNDAADAELRRQGIIV